MPATWNASRQIEKGPAMANTAPGRGKTTAIPSTFVHRMRHGMRSSVMQFIRHMCDDEGIVPQPHVDPWP